MSFFVIITQPVGSKAKGPISKRVLQESKGRHSEKQTFLTL